MRTLLPLALVALMLVAGPNDAWAKQKKTKKKERPAASTESIPTATAPPGTTEAPPVSLLEAVPITSDAAGPPLASTGDSPLFIQAQITDVQLKGPPKPALAVSMDPPSLPLDLAVLDPVSNPSWDASFTLLGNGPDWTALVGKSAVRFKGGKAQVTLPLTPGRTVHRITVIDPFGKTSEYDLTAQVDRIAQPSAALGPEPKGFLVFGPAFFTRSITRGGTAVAVPSQASGLMAGVRGIYRRRLLKDFTARVPGQLKFFWDNSGTIGNVMSGDNGAKGLPIWADSRATLEFFQSGSFRVEGGAGFSLFMPGMSVAQAGDLNQFFGFMLSTRVGFALSEKLRILTGYNFTLPSSDAGPGDLLVTQPMETFLSLTAPRGSDGFWELRIKYYRIKTTGTVIRSGNFERVETFLGPELLWSKRF